VRKVPLFLFLTFLFAGCISKGYRGVPFWHAMGGPLGDVLNGIIDDFNKQHPDSLPIVSVKMGNYSTLSQKLMGAVAAGKPPVLAQVYESWTSELLSAGKIVPLDRYIMGENGLGKEILDDIFPIFLEDNRWEGEFITFPFNKSVPVFYYNMDLFEKYGIEEFPKTWDEFREIAKKLTIDTDGDGKYDIYGTAFPVNVWMFETLLYQKGGALIKDGKAAFNSKEGVEALQYFVDLIYKDSCAYLSTGYRHQDDFAVGKVAMVWGTIVSYSFMKDKITFRLGVARIPRDRDSVVVISGTNVALFSDVPEVKREKAFEFIKYFLTPEVQARWSIGTGYLPLRRSVLERPEMKEFLSKVPGMKEAILSVEHAIYEPRTPAWFTGRRYLETEGLEPVFLGYLSPREALDRAAALIDVELQRIEKRAKSAP